MIGRALIFAGALMAATSGAASPGQGAKPVPDAAPAPTPYVKNPLYWPTPIMDRVPPRLPRLRRGAVLILSKTNGFRDSEQIRAATAALEKLVKGEGRDVFVTENAAVMNRRDLGRFSAVILNSTSGTIFDAGQRAAFRRWIERGGGVVMLHGAGGDHDYDWRWYVETLLGAQFIGHTSKPDQFQPGTIHVIDRDHPATRDLPAEWSRVEEWYAFDHAPHGQGTRILATLDEGSYAPGLGQRMGRIHPVVWTRCVGRGRIFFSALGHKAETYAELLHLKLIDGAIRWATRAEGAGC